MSVQTPQSIWQKITAEKDQATICRESLLTEIGKELGNRAAVSYYTSFTQYGVQIDDGDISVLEDVLMASDVKARGLLLILSSPGGDPMAAERIINVCRQYSAGNFSVLVPKLAKSAATMICFGSDCIYMSRTSELGPTDPQFRQKLDEVWETVPADLLIRSYRTLLKDATECQGRVEPYLQQLQHYDSRRIAVYERSQELGTDIAVNALQQSMMKGKGKTYILRKIKPFIQAEERKAHARPILIEDARKCGLKVEEIDIHGDLWRKIMELHLRSDLYVMTAGSKLIESAGLHFSAPTRTGEPQ